VGDGHCSLSSLVRGGGKKAQAHERKSEKEKVRDLKTWGEKGRGGVSQWGVNYRKGLQKKRPSECELTGRQKKKKKKENDCRTQRVYHRLKRRGDERARYVGHKKVAPGTLRLGNRYKGSVAKTLSPRAGEAIQQPQLTKVMDIKGRHAKGVRGGGSPNSGGGTRRIQNWEIR